LIADTQPYLIVGEQGTGALLVGGATVVNAKGLSLGHNGGTGTVTQTGGTVNAPAGVLLGGLSSAGRGTYNLNGGTLNTAGVARGAGAGTLNFNGGTLRAVAGGATFLQGLTAANVQAGGGTIDTNGYDLTVVQPLAGPGALIKAGTGTLALTGNNSFAGGTRVDGGTLAVNGALASGVTVAAGARLGGGGTIAGGLDVSGDVAPGNSPGNLTVGSARFRAGSSLTIELAGPANYDRLTLGGAATLDTGATLMVLLPGGFVPGGGQSFDVLAYGSVSGRFSSYSGVDVGGGLVLAPFYLGDALRLMTTLRGDADGDGRVSFLDYQRLERGFGKPGGWQDGDFNLDGVVDGADFRLMYDNVGRSVTVTAPLPAQPVPEPAGAGLTSAAAVIALAGRRRQGGARSR
jgi:autotransporter-associated beta strand protein